MYNHSSRTLALTLAVAALAACNGITEAPVPVLASISPDTATLGRTGVSFTASGSDFRPQSTVRWNGADLATTFVSPAELRASLPDALLQTVVTAEVTVFTPGGGSSAARAFSVRLPSTIEECETFSVQICGIWTLQGDRYLGAWEDGATANLTVVRITATEFVLSRVDFGKNQNFTALYTGVISGRNVAGAVTWNASGNSRSGTWFARW